MDQTVPVAQMYERLLELASPLSPLDLPLLDAHGATMASDLLLDEKVAIKSGAKISSTQIALAASLGLDRLPSRPHPRVVIISAGDDLVEPGSKLGANPRLIYQYIRVFKFTPGNHLCQSGTSSCSTWGSIKPPRMYCHGIFPM